MTTETPNDQTTTAEDAERPIVERLVMRYRKWRHNREWEYGTCEPEPGTGVARRHRRKGNVQFVLWKAGEQGHTEDYWHDFDSSWWPSFKPFA